MVTLSDAEMDAAKKLGEAVMEFLIALEVGRHSRMPAPAVPQADVRLPVDTWTPPRNAVPTPGSPEETEPDDAIVIGVREAARLLGVCEKTLWSLSVPRGSIPVVQIGRSVRYTIDDLQAWVKRARVTGGREVPRNE